MVSGLVTSPCDQLRIFSGDARLMRIASKSAIGFAMSKGLERYKVFLRFLRVLTCPLTTLETSLQLIIVSCSPYSLDWAAQEPSRPSSFPSNLVASVAVSRRGPTADDWIFQSA